MFVTKYLEDSANRYPNKKAFIDENRSITFSELQRESKCIAMALIEKNLYSSPIAIYLEKSVECIAAFMGTLYSTNFYTMIDVKMPGNRIQKIIDVLEPAAFITDRMHLEEVRKIAGNTEIICYEDALELTIDQEIIGVCENKINGDDIMYVLFTSGSTGIPKGVMITHYGLRDFIEWGREEFRIDEKFIFGNQTPFYFSMSVFDIYETIKNAATMYIIPQNLFSLPTMLMQYMYDHSINTVFWVPSALSFLSALGALKSPFLPELKHVYFGGESMPMKQLNRWMGVYTEAEFVNFYGPTEVTDTCTFYRVNRRFENQESLPMGKACKNKDVFLLDENGQLVKDGEIGEVCVRGIGLAKGYYNNPEKTAEVFVQNPLNSLYEEKIYLTGDLAMKNEFGEFVYISRKDFQIKHMGRRIELGEIETAISSIEEIESCCCLYNKKRSKIVMIYQGNIEEKMVMTQLMKLVPEYMLPNIKIKLDKMPLNLNGKVDRKKLEELYIN